MSPSRGSPAYNGQDIGTAPPVPFYNPTADRPQAASPPVAVKVRVHDDHVTLRRLNEEEAAAERELRRRAKEQQQLGARFAGPSVSDLSASGPSAFYRRQQQPGGSVSPLPPMVSNQQSQSPAPGFGGTNQPQPNAASAPYPRQSLYTGQASPGASGGTAMARPTTFSPGAAMGNSPGAYETATGTEMSNFEENRKRRRAERVRNESMRLGAKMGAYGSGSGSEPGQYMEEAGPDGGRRAGPSVSGGSRRVGFADQTPYV